MKKTNKQTNKKQKTKKVFKTNTKGILSSFKITKIDLISKLPISLLGFFMVQIISV